MGNRVTRKPWHVPVGSVRGRARLPPACGTQGLPSPHLHLPGLQSFSILLPGNRRTPCQRHGQSPRQLAPDSETGALAWLLSPVLLTGRRVRDPENSPWALLVSCRRREGKGQEPAVAVKRLHSLIAGKLKVTLPILTGENISKNTFTGLPARISSTGGRI